MIFFLEAHVLPEEEAALERLLFLRTCRRVPTPYLVSQAALGDFSFYVDERVLIPRSFIAHFLINDCPEYIQQPPQRILDLCTGSGCLAIIAASVFPEAQVDASDISYDALNVAERNVLAYDLKDRIHLYQGDCFEAITGHRYDLIMTNPPYVCTDSYGSLPREYYHEPSLALLAGEDGMDCIDTILKQASSFLSDHGCLILELGYYRPMFERRYPGLVTHWLSTETDKDVFFILSQADLLEYWQRHPFSEKQS